MGKTTLNMPFHIHKAAIAPFTALDTVLECNFYRYGISGKLNDILGRHNIPPSATPGIRIPGFYQFPVPCYWFNM
jgi:hypothetical protein